MTSDQAHTEPFPQLAPMATASAERLRSGSPPVTPSSGTNLRRAATAMDDNNTLRYRGSPRAGTFDDPISMRRRSSTFSDLSFSEARKNLASSTDDILLPGADPNMARNQEGSHWDSMPLAFALLPAVGGMMFTNGSLVTTDIILLGLAAIFLNWSVRLPWNWYHSAQSLRVLEEQRSDGAIEDSDDDLAGSAASLEDVPEDHEPKLESHQPRSQRERTALKELYAHEVMALISCFLAPLLGAYLLHTIRNQLSRPSEGLVSNYNLTIFLLASEMRPLGHLAKLVQARTLHLQRVVAQNPHVKRQDEDAHGIARIEELLVRVEELESRPALRSPANGPSGDAGANNKQAAVVLAEVRRTLQPELDALNRAVRRYEKRAAIQTMQTEARLRDLDARLNDAISLAAAAAKNSQPRSLMGPFLEAAGHALLLPFYMIMAVMKLPFKTLGIATTVGKRAQTGGSGPVAEGGSLRQPSSRTLNGRITPAQVRIAPEKLAGTRLGKR